VAVATWFINYAIETRPGTDASLGSKLLAGAQAGFTVGRFAGVILMRFIRPRIIFMVFLGAVIIFLAAATGARHNAGIGK